MRFTDLRAVTRSVTLDVPISATVMLAEIGEELVRAALADHPGERTITLLAISVSHLRSQPEIQLDLPLGLPDEKRRPGASRGIARWTADRAVDAIRERFGWAAVGYGSAALEIPGRFPTRSGSLPRKIYDRDPGRRPHSHRHLGDKNLTLGTQ
ncbi:hypothetical protein GCM10010869_73130 [Mesorhizobium tianshanense]|nr:hypothetical protein GCM10010869_73130 [Mesorhizobium tianshanense]